MSEQKINVELLERVKALILEEPRKLDMGTWAASAGRTKKDERPPCGTVACIAGWACILDHVDRTGAMPKGRALARVNYEAADRARVLLGLNYDQADRLFDPPVEIEPDDDEGYYETDNLWPEDLARDYLDAETPAERARVTAERIDHFIATSGAE